MPRVSTPWLVTLYLIAGALEAGGLTVVALDLRSTLQTARRWREAGRSDGAGTTWAQIEGLGHFLDALAGSHPKRRAGGVGALILGLILATIANVASVLR